MKNLDSKSKKYIILVSLMLLIAAIGVILALTINSNDDNGIENTKYSEPFVLNELIFTDINEAKIIASRYDGEVTRKDEEISLYVVELPINNIEELYKIHDELKDQGFSASLIPVLTTN